MIPVAAKWKAYVDNRPFDRRNFDIFLYREINEDGRVRVLNITGVDEHGELTFTEKEMDMGVQNIDTPPTFRLPREMASALMIALSNHGVKPPDDGKLVGLYEAQSKHLVDLQTVLTVLLKIPPSMITLNDDANAKT